MFYIIASYIMCCIFGLIFSLMGMKFRSVRRPLCKYDLYATIFFTITGFFGTIVIVYFLMQHLQEERKINEQKGIHFN